MNITNILPPSGIIEVDKCATHATELIVGGPNARIGQFPHVVLLGYEHSDGSTSFDCSGSLISEEFVLAPAHCMYNRVASSNVKKVRLGSLNSALNEDNQEVQDVLVEKIYLHPEFKQPSKYNDIALLKLQSLPKLNWKVKPACLHTQKEIGESKPIAIDYELQNFGGPKRDEPLVSIKLNILSNLLCNKTFPVSRKLSSGIKDTQLCTDDGVGYVSIMVIILFVCLFFIIYFRLLNDSSLTYSL